MEAAVYTRQKRLRTDCRQPGVAVGDALHARREVEYTPEEVYAHRSCICQRHEVERRVAEVLREVTTHVATSKHCLQERHAAVKIPEATTLLSTGAYRAAQDGNEHCRAHLIVPHPHYRDQAQQPEAPHEVDNLEQTQVAVLAWYKRHDNKLCARGRGPQSSQTCQQRCGSGPMTVQNMLLYRDHYLCTADHHEQG